MLFKLRLDFRLWKLIKKILLIPPILNCEDFGVHIHCFTDNILSCFTAALAFLLLAFLHLLSPPFCSELYLQGKFFAWMKHI